MCGKLGHAPIEPVQRYTCLTGFVGVFVIQRWSGSFIRAPNVNNNVTKAANMFIVFTWLQFFLSRNQI